MIDIEKTKKFGADKVVLLGLFAMSLLIARIIVASKTGIILSKPIELPYSGLAVCMPDKNGWKSQGKWSFEENSFTVSSVFLPGISKISANAKCTYVLAADRESPEKWLSLKTREYAADTNDAGNIETGGLNFNWAYLKEEGNLASILIATTILSDGRWLDIEILDTTMESDMALKVFKKMVSNIRYEPSQLLADGQKLVEELKNSGLEVIDKDRELLDFFFIKDAARREIGFTMEHTNSAEDSPNIEKVGFSYLKARVTREEASIFQCDKNLTGFFWNSQTTSGRNITSTIELNLTQNKLLTVAGLFANDSQRQYIISAAAIPYCLLDNLFIPLIASKQDKIIVDLIYSNSVIKPVVISLEKSQLDGIFYIIKLQDLDKSQPSEEYHLDDQMRLVKILIRQDAIFMLERSTMEDIIKKFPERADFILDRKNTFEKSLPSGKTMKDNFDENI